MKFKEAMESFMLFSVVHHSKGTHNYYKGKRKQLIIFFGDMEINTISKTNVLEFIEAQRVRNPDISNATINKYVAALKYILKFECKVNLEFPKLKEIHRIIPTIPNNIIKLIFRHYETIKNPTPSKQRDNLMFRMLLDTGLRINELINLRIRDIDFDESTIHVKVTKSSQERYTFFRADTHKLLNKYIITNKIEDYLFIDFRTGEQITVNSVETTCVRLKDDLNIKVSISPHKWRHTFATLFLKRNKDLEVLRLILGHSKLSTTQKYLHLDKDFLHEIYFN